jgi:hypothetical protein
MTSGGLKTATININDKREEAMNKARRSEINKIMNLVSELKDRIEFALVGEQESFENMPESFQGGEKGEKAQEAINNFESAMSSLEDANNYLEEAKA